MGRDDFAASAVYQPDPTSVASARRFVRNTLQEWVVNGAAAGGTGLVDDAVLLTSELVTNAVVHAGTTVQVSCRLAGAEVEVVVADSDPAGLLPEPRSIDSHLSAERTSGRGLLLPAALASAWGVTYGRSAKAVWFRLDLTGHAAAGGARPGGRDGGSVAGAGFDEWLAGATALADSLNAVPVAGMGAVPRPRVTAEDRRRVPDPADPGYDRFLASILRSARGMVSADASYALMINEDGELRMRAAAGRVPSGHAPPAGDGAAAWAEHQQDPVDLVAGRAVSGEVPSVLTVPVVVDGQVIGLLSVVSATPGKFADEDAGRLQRLADRWGPPLERARLAEMERLSRVRLSALADARGLLAGPVDRDRALGMAADAVVPRLAPWCAVLLPEDEALRAVFARHTDDGWSAGLASRLQRAWDQSGGTDQGTAARMPSQEAVPRAAAWRWPLTGTEPDGGAPDADALAADDAWCFPLGDGDTRGLFVIGHRRHERPPRDVVALVADLACRVGIALQGHPKQAARKRRPAAPARGKAERTGGRSGAGRTPERRAR